MKQIPLTQNQYAPVDDADYGWLNRYKWCAIKNGYTFYAVRAIRINGKRTTLRMHRLILGLIPGDGKETDHIDQNGLNNQRSNLRICSRSENNQNQQAIRGSTSQYKGISRSKSDKKWRARLYLNGQQKHLGYFPSETDAAVAYNRAAKKAFGEFARLNKIEER